MDGGPPAQSPVARLAKGLAPIGVVLGLLYALSRDARAGLASEEIAVALCALILWVGWRWMQASPATRWLGRLLAIDAGLALVLFPLGLAPSFGTLLLVLALLAILAWLYDLFVGQPHKGRFSRARAERRALHASLPDEDDHSPMQP